MTTTPPLDLVTIFVGSHERVAVLETVLAAEGIPSFVPDRAISAWHPFITGFFAPHLRLQVPTPHVAAAREIAATFEPPAPAPRAAARQRRRWLVVLLLVLGPSAVALLVMLASR